MVSYSKARVETLTHGQRSGNGRVVIAGDGDGISLCFKFYSLNCFFLVAQRTIVVHADAVQNGKRVRRGNGSNLCVRRCFPRLEEVCRRQCATLRRIAILARNDPDHGVYQILRGRRVFLEDGLNRHIALGHEERIVGDSHVAADDLPLLEVVAVGGRNGQDDFRAGRSLCMRCGSRAVSVIGHGYGVLGGGGVGYRNRQLLLIVAHAVESPNGKLGCLFRSGRAADLAGGLFQSQAIGQLATEKLPQNEASPSCLKLMVVRRADRAAGQRRGSNRRRILRT